MMLAAYFAQYPSHLAAAARRQASVGGGQCPLHPHGPPPDAPPYTTLLSYPLMASVPEEDRSEGGRTYTVSSKSDRQDEEEEDDIIMAGEQNGDHRNDHNGDVKQSRSSPRSCQSSDDILPKKTSFASSYHTARGKSPSEQYYTGRDSSERSSPSRDRVYDPTRNSYIPRDPDCPIHSPKGGSSLRSSPARTTPTRESPTRVTTFNRNSPTRVTTPPRTSPVRSSISRVSPSRGITPPLRSSPPTSYSATPRYPPTRRLPSRSYSSDSSTSLGPVHPSRMSAASSDLLHCTICTQRFYNPKVLPCLHTFCQQCLLTTTPAEALTISCPQCKQQSILPQAGVMDLQNNTWVQGVIDSLVVTTPPLPTQRMLPTMTRACCSICGSVSPSHKCVQCHTSLCRSCRDVHTKESEHENYEPITPPAATGQQYSSDVTSTDGGSSAGPVDHCSSNSADEGGDNSALADQCQNASITVDQSQNGSVATEQQCQNSSVAEQQTQNGTVPTEEQCQNGSVATEQCQNGSVATEECQNGSVATEECQNGSVAPEQCPNRSSSPTVAGHEAAATHGSEISAAHGVMVEGLHSFTDETTLHCPSHQGMTLRFYCRDCDTAVCISCTDIEHRLHATMRLCDAMTDQTAAMGGLLGAVANKLPAVSCCVEDLDEAVMRLSEKRDMAEQAVRATFSSLRELLDARERDLLLALDDKTKDKQTMLEKQRSELQGWLSSLESGSDLVKKAIQESRSPMELVLLKKQFGDPLKEQVNADLPPGPRENTLLSFEACHVTDVIAAVSRVGSVVTNPAVPYTTIASGDNLKQSIVGRKSYITVISRDYKGERVGIGGAELSAVFTPKHSPTPSPPVSPCSSKSSYPNMIGSAPSTPNPSNTSRAASEKSASPAPMSNGHSSNGHHYHQHHHPSLIRRQSTCEDNNTTTTTNTHDCTVKVLDHQNGVYDIEYVLHRVGKFVIDVNMYGMPIDQSPFTVTAVAAGSTCSVHGSEHSADSHYIRQRHSARFSNLSGRVSKGSRHTPSQRSSGSRITLPLEDDLILKVGIKGRNKGEFVNPQGICYSNIRGGRIVVTDSISQCVQVFTTDGEFKVRFGTRGRNVGQLQRPTGIATMRNGNYAVADYENKCVSIFEPNGKYVYRIGQGKLLGPKGVCCDRQGNFIVVDNKGSCVCIFQSSGRLLTKFGNRGTNYLQFAGPHFVAVTSKGLIVTTDFHNHCVKVFDSDGEFMFTFGSHGEGNGQFNAPTGIAVDDSDNIIVGDWGNCRIQVFDCRGSFLSFVNTLADPLHGPQGLTFTDDGHIVVADSGNHCYKVYKYLQ